MSRYLFAAGPRSAVMHDNVVSGDEGARVIGRDWVAWLSDDLRKELLYAAWMSFDSGPWEVLAWQEFTDEQGVRSYGYAGVMALAINAGLYMEATIEEVLAVHKEMLWPGHS